MASPLPLPGVQAAVGRQPPDLLDAGLLGLPVEAPGERLALPVAHRSAQAALLLRHGLQLLPVGPPALLELPQPHRGGGVFLSDETYYMSPGFARAEVLGLTTEDDF